MLAYCSNPSCGNVFENYVSIKNIVIDMTGLCLACPKCESPSYFLKETYEFDNNGIATLLSSPQLSSSDLFALKKLIHKAKDEKFSAEAIAIEAEKHCHN